MTGRVYGRPFKGVFNTTTVFMIVAFGTMTFLFFGINAFMDISYSANVVSEDIKLLNAVDATHLVRACLEGDDGIITPQEVGDVRSSCGDTFPGLAELGYEYLVECDALSLSFKTSGYDSMEGNSHYLFINVQAESDVYVGRLYVRTE